MRMIKPAMWMTLTLSFAFRTSTGAQPAAGRGLAPCAEVRRLEQLRANENAQRLLDAEKLQRRIREAVGTWEATPDRQLDHQSLCRLIDALGRVLLRGNLSDTGSC